MAAVYSVELFSMSAIPAFTPFTVTPPAGYVYVVRDVEAVNPQYLPWQSVRPFNITDSNGANFGFPGNFLLVGSVVYQWQGRQVIETGDHFTVETFDSYWNIRISGFKLSLP